MSTSPNRTRLTRRLAAAAVALVVPGGALLVPSTIAVVAIDAPRAAALCSLCAGGEFHPVAPERIFDSRPANDANPTLPINDVAPFGVKPVNAVPAGADAVTFDVDLLGRTGDAGFENPWLPDYVADSDVLAVVVNLIVVSPATKGYAMVYAAGEDSGQRSSVVNFQAGVTTSNSALVRPGAGGKLTVDLRGTSVSVAHVVVDVLGWYSTSTYDGDSGAADDGRGTRSITVTPGRVLDAPASAVGPASVTTVPILGARSIDASARVIVPDLESIEGVIVNLAVAGPTSDTYVSVLPEAPVSGPPSTSSANVRAGQTRSVMAIVPLGADGAIRLYNNAGNARLVVDVLGYLERRPDESRAGRVIPLVVPFRAFDTRRVEFGRSPLGPGQAEIWSFAAFSNSVAISSVSVGAQSGLFGNLTNASLARQYPTVPVSSNLRVFPALGPNGAPTISQLNSSEAGAVANMVMLTYGTASTSYAFNAAGHAHYLLDISAVILAD